MTINPTLVRQHFPSLNRPEVFFDNPGGTQAVKSCIDRTVRYYMECNANHGGAYTTSRDSDALVEEAHIAAADLLGAGPDEVFFGANMTTMTFALSRSLGQFLKKGDTIVCTRMDHDGNVSPWLMLAEDHGCKVRFVDFDVEDFTLNLKDMEAALSEKPKIVAFGAASNALGTINPVQKITRMAHEAGALVYVDAVQFTPHNPVDVKKFGCDFLVCSAYKFFGPHMGIIYGRRELLDELRFYKVRPAPNTPPGKFETGTGAFENMAGLLGVVEYLEWLGNECGQDYRLQLEKDYSGRALSIKMAMNAMIDYEHEIDRAMLPILQSIPGLTIYGITDPKRLDERVPTFAFTLKGKSPLLVADQLGKEGFFVWDGNYYALEVTTRLGLEDSGGMVRVGPVHYNTLDEVERFGHALQKVARM